MSSVPGERRGSAAPHRGRATPTARHPAYMRSVVGETKFMAPRTTTGAFDEFDAALNLDPREREKAERRHHEITDVLIAAGIAASTFLQGSFARKTMPKPLKDVDMVIVRWRPGTGVNRRARFRFMVRLRGGCDSFGDVGGVAAGGFGAWP
jgi:hypothetical protein